MKNVKKTNKILILLYFFLVVGCNNKKSDLKMVHQQKVDSVTKPLIFEINFSDFGEYKIEAETIKWENYRQTLLVYFNINLQNIKKEPFIVKMSIVSPKIPILIQYKKLKKVDVYTDGTKKEYVNLNIVQQFNTIYNDSIVFSLPKKADYPFAEQAFLVGYQKVGGRSICQLPIHQEHDTIDISNPENKHICCIEINK